MDLKITAIKSASKHFDSRGHSQDRIFEQILEAAINKRDRVKIKKKSNTESKNRD